MAGSKSITIEIGAKTTALKAALGEIDNQSKLISRQMKILQQDLKLDAGDRLEKLVAGLRLMKDNVAAADDKVKVLEKGIDALKEAHSAGKIGIDEYNQKLAKYSDELATAKMEQERSEHALADWQKQVEEANDPTEDLGESIKDIGKNSEDSGQKTLGLGDIIKGNLISSTIMGGLKSVVGLIGNIASGVWNVVKNAAQAGKEYAKEAIDMAADYEDALGYALQVFGDWEPDVIKFAETTTLALRSNKSEVLQNVNAFGSLLRSTGLGKDQAYEYSTSLVQLASDMRSATGTELPQVIQNLQSVMTGGAEAGYKYGLVIKDGAVKAKALQMGLVQTESDMTEVNKATLTLEKSQKNLAAALSKHGEGSFEYRDALQKVTEAEEGLDKAMEGKEIALSESARMEARYALIMEQSAHMQGQAAREAGNYKSQLDLQKTTFDNLKISIGQKLLPVVTEIMAKYNEFIQSKEGQELLDGIVEGVGTLADKALAFVESGELKAFADVWIPKVTAFGKQMIDDLPGMIDNIAELAENVNSFFSAIKYGSEDADAREAFNGVRGQVQKLADESGMNLATMKAVIADYAITNKVKLEDIYSDWGTYEPLISAHINNAKEEAILSTDAIKEKFTTFAADHGLQLDGLVGLYASWKDRTKENEDQVNTDLAAFAETNGLKLDELEGFFTETAGAVETEMQNTSGSVQASVDRIGNVKMTGPEAFRNTIRGWASDIQTNVEKALSWIGKMWDGVGFGGTGATPSYKFEARASGGPVYAGQGYLVGEQGPELFFPSVSGVIASNQQSRQLAAGSQAVSQQQILDAVKYAVAQAVAEIGSRQSIELTIPISAYLDNDVIYQGQRQVRYVTGQNLFEGRYTG